MKKIIFTAVTCFFFEGHLSIIKAQNPNNTKNYNLNNYPQYIIQEIAFSPRGFFFLLRDQAIINQASLITRNESILLEAYDENGKFKKDFNGGKPIDISATLSLSKDHLDNIQIKRDDLIIRMVPFLDDGVLIGIYNKKTKVLTLTIYDEFGKPKRIFFGYNMWTFSTKDLPITNIFNFNLGVDEKTGIWIVFTGENIPQPDALMELYRLFYDNHSDTHEKNTHQREPIMQIYKVISVNEEEFHLNLERANKLPPQLELIKLSKIRFNDNKMLIFTQFVDQTAQGISYFEGYLILHKTLTGIKDSHTPIIIAPKAHLDMLLDKEIDFNSETGIAIVEPAIFQRSETNIHGGFFLGLKTTPKSSNISPIISFRREKMLDGNLQQLQYLLNEDFKLTDSAFSKIIAKAQIFRTNKGFYMFVWDPISFALKLYIFDLNTKLLLQKKEFLLTPARILNPFSSMDVCANVFYDL